MRADAPAALLLVDVQQGLDDPKYGARNKPGAEGRIAALLAAWREAGWPVVHVQHMSRQPDSPLRPERPGNALKAEALPREGEPLFRKEAHSAFVGTGLEAHLRDAGIEALVVVGLTTDHCVSTTARMAADLGFATVVVADATATHERTGPDGVRHSADQMHRLALASLHGEFAEVRTTDEVLATLPRRSPPGAGRSGARILLLAPPDDEPETEEERALVEEGLRDIREGRVRSHQDVKRSLGLE